MPVFHGLTKLPTVSSKIRLELKNNTVSVVMEGKVISSSTVADNDYQRLLSYAREATKSTDG